MHHGSQAAAGHATPREVFLATLAYTGVTFLMTWPLGLGLGVDIPSDLGDPALNVFILGRNLQRFESALRGHLEALRTFWDARIFHPEPLSLAYSEHLLAQSLLVLPVRLFSDNVILAYNAAFLASFVLSALGAYLLARELLGRSDVAFLTGLLFGFAPYRVDQLSHIQVLSQDVCFRDCVPVYGIAPCVNFCPAAVYEHLRDDSGERIQVNFSNCVHCKTCGIVDPCDTSLGDGIQNIRWRAPNEGGPKYTNL